MKYEGLEALARLVTKRFIAAQESRSLIFSETELAIIHHSRGAPFELRYCPALAKKPAASTPSDDDQTRRQSPKPKKPDPFENPSTDLLIAKIPRSNPSHALVLNKYPVIANHFILATETYKPQTDLLEVDDLEVTYSCLKAWEQDGITGTGTGPRLFAFFNSGEHSGASQAHRHVQFLPVQDMIESLSSSSSPSSSPPPAESEFQLLTERMTENCADHPDLLHDPSLPVCHYATLVPPNCSPGLLHQKYLRLYHAAARALAEFSPEFHDQPVPPTQHRGHAGISYNLAMTSEVMAILPRRHEAAIVSSGPKDGSVSINGTILGGTLMVKDAREWQSLRETPSLLDELLVEIGVPRRV